LVVLVMSLYMWIGLLQTTVAFNKNVRKVEAHIEQLCATGRDTFSLDVTTTNGSSEPLTGLAHIFEIRYRGKLIASVVELSEFEVDPGGEHHQTLSLESPLATDVRPSLSGCGFQAGWTASGTVRIAFPGVRKMVGVHTKAGEGQ